MRRYSRGKLEQHMGDEGVVAAADELRSFEDGNAWFRLQQKWSTLEDGVLDILRRSPQEASVYHVASGKLQMLESIFESFNEILSEGAAKRQ